MGSYTTGIADLRTLLSDSGVDRYVYRHKCFGPANGSNRQFKTFYRRRATDFTSSADSVDGPGVYKNGVQLASSAITRDKAETGEFILASGSEPADGDEIEASYYYQWFNDDELEGFLRISSQWLQGGDDYTNTPGPLQDPLLKYAANQAYLKMAQRWRTYISQDYRVEDAPKDSPTYDTNEFLSLAKAMRKDALDSRTEYFKTRQGRAMQPLFGTVSGNVKSLGTGSGS